MELSPYVSALRESLTATAAAGDEQVRTAARVLAATIEPAARLAIMNALADLAGEVTLALGDRVVEVRLAGQDVQVVVTGAPVEDPEPADEPPPATDPTGDITRITVRLLEELKSKAEEAASARGVSLNSFVSQAVQGALRSNARGRGGNWGGEGPWSNQNWGAWGQWGNDSRRKPNDGGGRGSSRVRGWVEE
jgi:hypothetical protein